MTFQVEEGVARTSLMRPSEILSVSLVHREISVKKDVPQSTWYRCRTDRWTDASMRVGTYSRVSRNLLEEPTRVGSY